MARRCRPPRRSSGPRRPTAACHRRSEEHTSELQSRPHLVCRLLLEKKKKRPLPSAPTSHFHGGPPQGAGARAIHEKTADRGTESMRPIIGTSVLAVCLARETDARIS